MKKDKQEENSNKIKSAIQLAIGLVFILVVFIMTRFGNKDIPYQEIPKQNIKSNFTYEEKVTNFVKNYEYEYEIKYNNQIYKFVGKVKDNKESGYRIYNDLYLYYYQENDKLYTVNEHKLKELDNLYNDIDTSYFNYDNLKTILANEYVLVDNVYEYLVNGIKYKVYVSNNNIEKIIIEVNDNYYELNYKNIGSVKEINY